MIQQKRKNSKIQNTFQNLSLLILSMSQQFSLPRLNTDIDDITSTNPFNDGFINNEETVFAKY